MKTINKLFLISIFIIGGNINLFAQNTNIYSKDKAWQIVKEKILKEKVENVNIYVSKDIIEANSQIKILYKEESSPVYDAWFFFIDDKPFASWSHPCRYVYVNAKNGKTMVLNKKLPPDFGQMEPLIEQKIEVKGKLFDFSKYQEKSKNICSAENDYAVIINGGGRKEINWVRYWNHCSALYSALINVYGYSDDHIYVLVSDGTNPANDRRHHDGSYDSSPLDLDGDGDNDIQFSATRANITHVFNTLQNILTSDDNLFIYTTDHGAQESGQDVTLGLWNETMRDDEFAVEVNKVNAGRINICMVQCHSGGFIDDLQGSNRVIATSCKYDEGASAMPPDYLYSEFTYHWISAIAGETPYGDAVDADSNNDGFVSMAEAFSYAKNHDTRPDETPQYNSMPSSFGNYMALNGQIPYISGTNTVCTSNSTFTLNNRPPGTTVNWTKSSNLTPVGGNTGTTYTVRANGNGSGWVQAVISGGGCGDVTISKDFWVGIPNKPTNITFYPSNPCLNQIVIALVSANNPAISEVHYEWRNTHTYIDQNPSGSEVHFTTLPSFPYTTNVYVKGTNSCGSSSEYSELLSVKDCGGGGGGGLIPVPYSVEGPVLLVSPNPANDYLEAEIVDDNFEQGSNNKIHIKLFNNRSIPVYTGNSHQQTFRINTSNLPHGLYLLQVIYKGEKYSKQILIEH